MAWDIEAAALAGAIAQAEGVAVSAQEAADALAERTDTLESDGEVIRNRLDAIESALVRLLPDWTPAPKA
jgi:hypothetical protein